MSTDSDREKILAKIQKCMRLSKSSEAHEAAAALRQAQKMMQQHGVSHEELMGMEVGSASVLTPEPMKKKTPLYMAHLVSLLCAAFDVQAVYDPTYIPTTGKVRMSVRYFGVNGKPEMAKYAHEVIWRQLRTCWNAYSRERPWISNQKGARTGFWVGWLCEVREQVMAFGGSEEERAMVKNAIAAAYKGDVKPSTTNKTRVSGQAMAAGSEAAKDFALHRPVTGAAGEPLLQLS